MRACNCCTANILRSLKFKWICSCFLPSAASGSGSDGSGYGSGIHMHNAMETAVAAAAAVTVVAAAAGSDGRKEEGTDPISFVLEFFTYLHSRPPKRCSKINKVAVLSRRGRSKLSREVGYALLHKWLRISGRSAMMLRALMNQSRDSQAIRTSSCRCLCVSFFFFFF